MLLAAAMFSAVHLDVDHFVRLLFIGLLWCYMTLKSESLLPAIMSHTIFDIFSVTLVPELLGSRMYLWLAMWHIWLGFAVILGILLTKRMKSNG